MKSKNKALVKLSFIMTLYIMLAFLGSGLIVLAIVEIFNFVSKTYVQQNPTLFLIICLASTWAMGGIIGYFIFRLVSNRTKTVSELISKISEGDFSKKFPVPNGKGIGLTHEVMVEFNKMVDRLNQTAILQTSFASNFSHEFKTPIVSIKGYAELLRDNKNLTEEEKLKYVSIIISEANRLTDLATSTLLISKLDSTPFVENLTPVNIKQQIEESVILLDGNLQEKNLEVELNLCPNKFLGNENMLKEVWINLLSNAVKYNVLGGKITVTSTLTDDNYLVSFTDTGIGIDDKTLPHLFDKFYQGESSRLTEGNGLGLSIVKRILTLHGGDITVSSKKGEGSTFTVILPIKN